MTKPQISIVVAIAGKNRCIGNGANLLVRISDDLKRFKTLTTGHPIIMGRKTYESIGKPLPNRTNIIITRNQDFKAEGVIITSSIDEAIKKAAEIDSQIFVIGGGQIYAQALPYIDKIYMTYVDIEAEGDAFFPDYSEFKKETFREERVDEKTGLKYSWIDLER